MEMMYFSASSTLISSSRVSARGTMRKKPAVMLGVVGTNTESGRSAAPATTAKPDESTASDAALTA